ncbi:MAG: hypothetical protein WKG00_28840 [Polyangiaceae bacterium]
MTAPRTCTAATPPTVPFQAGATMEAPASTVSEVSWGTRTTCALPPSVYPDLSPPQELSMVMVFRMVLTPATATSS